MALNPAPIQEPIAGLKGMTPLVWVRWFSQLSQFLNAQSSTGSSLTASGAPTVPNGQALVWLAAGSGTKDGQPYEQGDVLITSAVGGVSKTLLVLDWSAI